MLLRFQQDVVALRPAAVVFLGGTNDVAGNTGPMKLAMTEDNICSMVAVAQANGIKVILASQLPVKEFTWNKDVHPELELLALSAWEKQFAIVKHLGYVDYYSVLVGPVPRQNYDLPRNQSDRSVAGFACLSVSNWLHAAPAEASVRIVWPRQNSIRPRNRKS